MTEKKVTKEQFGKDWPLLVGFGSIISDNGSIVFSHGESAYALNGVASSRGYDPIDIIWAPNPEIKGAKKSLGAMIEYGLGLDKE